MKRIQVSSSWLKNQKQLLRDFANYQSGLQPGDKRYSQTVIDVQIDQFLQWWIVKMSEDIEFEKNYPADYEDVLALREDIDNN